MWRDEPGVDSWGTILGYPNTRLVYECAGWGWALLLGAKLSCSSVVLFCGINLPVVLSTTTTCASSKCSRRVWRSGRCRPQQVKLEHYKCVNKWWNRASVDALHSLVLMTAIVHMDSKDNHVYAPRAKRNKTTKRMSLGKLMICQ